MCIRDRYWNSKFAIPYEEFIPWYKPRWVRPERSSQRSVAEQFKQVDLPTLEPNIMQQQFIANFNELRANPVSYTHLSVVKSKWSSCVLQILCYPSQALC